MCEGYFRASLHYYYYYMNGISVFVRESEYARRVFRACEDESKSMKDDAISFDCYLLFLAFTIWIESLAMLFHGCVAKLLGLELL